MSFLGISHNKSLGTKMTNPVPKKLFDVKFLYNDVKNAQKNVNSLTMLYPVVNVALSIIWCLQRTEDFLPTPKWQHWANPTHTVQQCTVLIASPHILQLIRNHLFFPTENIIALYLLACGLKISPLSGSKIESFFQKKCQPYEIFPIDNIGNKARGISQNS